MTINKLREVLGPVCARISRADVRRQSKPSLGIFGQPETKERQACRDRRRRNFQTVVNNLFHFARTRHYVVGDVVDEICEIEYPKVVIVETGLTPEQIKHRRREAGVGGREIAVVEFASVTPESTAY